MFRLLLGAFIALPVLAVATGVYSSQSKSGCSGGACSLVAAGCECGQCEDGCGCCADGPCTCEDCVCDVCNTASCCESGECPASGEACETEVTSLTGEPVAATAGCDCGVCEEGCECCSGEPCACENCDCPRCAT